MWPLILDFVETYFGEDDLAHFKKYFSLTIDHSNDPIVKAGGLQAMLACFLKNNKDVLKEFKAHIGAKDTPAVANGKKSKKAESSSSEEESSASSSEDDSESSSEDEKPAPKKPLVGNKRKAKESSDESSSEGSDSDDEDDKKKKPAQKRQRKDSISSRTRSHSDVKEAPKAPEKPKGPIQPLKFARINEDKVKHLVNMEKEGASFESKAKFGGEGDKFG